MKKIVCLLLVLLTALCACAEQDELTAVRAEIARLEEENRYLTQLLDAYRDNSVIAVFDGGNVSFAEVYALYSEIEALYSDLWELYGEQEVFTAENALEIQQEITRNLVEDKVIDAWLEKNRIELLTGEQTEAAAAEGRAEYALLLEETTLYYIEEGLDPDAAAAQAQAELIEIGSSEEEMIRFAVDNARSAALTDLLAGEVTVSEEELEEAYLARVQEDTLYYSAYPEDFAVEMLYGTSGIAYIPEGYRRARLILIPFDEEAMNEYDLLYVEEPTEENLARADALYEALRPAAEEVSQRLGEGESFDILLQEYTAGEIYMAELCTESGFCVCDGCYLIDEEAVGAVMALENPGDVTAPVRTGWGWAILEYSGDLEAGTVPLENIRESLYESVYEQLRLEACSNAVERLCEEANVVYFFERLG